MKYFIAVPVPTNKIEENDVYESRMRAIHTLQAEGHEVAYNVFEGDWWSEETMKNRGIKDTKLHYLAKAIEELSKCDGIYIAKMTQLQEVWRADPMRVILANCASFYDLDIRYED